jgi:hypothetical protein
MMPEECFRLRRSFPLRLQPQLDQHHKAAVPVNVKDPFLLSSIDAITSIGAAVSSSNVSDDNLARLLARRVDGIHLAPFEQGEIGPELFRHACLMGLEGLVSKLKDRPYRYRARRRFESWIRTKSERFD